MNGYSIIKTSSSEAMSLSKKLILVVCLLLLDVLEERGSGGRQVFSVPADSLAQIPLNDDMVEKLLLDCGIDRKDIGEVLEGLSYNSFQELIHASRHIYLERKLYKGTSGETIPFLSPEIARCIFECLSKRNLPLASGSENHENTGYFHYLDSLPGSSPPSRRYLANQLSQKKAADLAPPSSDTVGDGSVSQLLFYKEDYSPPPAKSLFPLVFKKTSDVPPVAPNKQGYNSSTLIIAIVISIVGTSFVTAIFFIFYKKCSEKNGYAHHGLKDERPLLGLSTSDFPGSSHNSFGVQMSIEKDKMGPSSFKTESVHHGHVSVLTGDITEPPAAKPFPEIGISTEQFSQATEDPELKPISLTLPPKLAAVHSIVPPALPTIAPPVPEAAPPPPEPPPAPPPPPPPANTKSNAPLPPTPPTPPPPPPGNTKSTAPPPPPSPSIINPGTAPPPPPPKLTGPPSLLSSRAPRPPSLRRKQSGNEFFEAGEAKTKLKPFFWDKVVATDQAMVWDRIKAGSFQFNEEMIESLFGYTPATKLKTDDKNATSKGPQYIRILDPKKSQNLAISLKALNVKTEEVCRTIMEGGMLPAELLQTVLKMAPTTDEELKLRLYTGNILELGPAEQFLKVLVDVPYAFQRLENLLLMACVPEEVSTTRESISIIEAASEELKSSRLFLKLLEAVLKTGNRMNSGTYRGGAQAFKLDTLLKLADVKGTDGKTTLLHFVVQEIIRSEGVRAVRVAREQSGSISIMKSDDLTSLHESEDYLRKVGLKVVSGLGDELENVKKAAGLDADALANTVASLGCRLNKAKEFLNTSMKSLDEDSGFSRSIELFVEQSEPEITFLQEEEKRIRILVQKTTDFFHGKEGKDEGLRLFVIVRNFLGMLDKACKEVRETPRRVEQPPKGKEEPSPSASPARDPRQLLFPAIRDRRADCSSSDDES